MSKSNNNVIQPENGVPFKAWTKDIAIEGAAEKVAAQCGGAVCFRKWDLGGE